MLAKDLVSRQEARDLVVRGIEAQENLNKLSQEEANCIVRAMVEAAEQNALHLARMAVEETRMGNVEDKVTKNLLASRGLYTFIKDMKTVGVIGEDKARKIVEIAAPVGLIAAVIPTTNPTSTVIFKSISSLKSRNAVVFSPHPRAIQSSLEAARIMETVAKRAGAPNGSISCMSMPTIEGTQELMQHPQVALILATGGSGLVKAAYSSGKPAYGVGPGNVPVFIEQTANVEDAVRKIVEGKCFDNGTICSSEQAVVVEHGIKDLALSEFARVGGYLLSLEEQELLARLVVINGGLNPEIVGKSALTIAQMAGLKVPSDTRVLLAALDGVGKGYPLSMEKLSPILAFYSVPTWQDGLQRCIELLNFGGLGHTAVIHSNNEKVIREFALQVPASRVLVNTPSSKGAVGAATGLPPSMTLGCGTWGHNITTDSITPFHLLNIKRMASHLNAAKDSTNCQVSGAPAIEEIVRARLLAG